MTRRRTQFAARALDDLTAIGDYIAQDNPARARSFVRELVARCRSIAEQPRAARLRPEIGAGVRAVVSGAYLILYTHRDDGSARVERIVHGAREAEGLLDEQGTGDFNARRRVVEVTDAVIQNGRTLETVAR